MPRKRAPAEPVPEDIQELAELGVAEVPPDVEGVLDELGGQISRVVLFRKPERGAQYEFVGELDADAFTLRAVQEQFGGGHYLVRFAGPDPRADGAIRWLKAKTFVVASLANRPINTPATVAGGGDMAAVMRELIAEIRASRSPTDPAAMMAAVAQMGAAVGQQVSAILPLLAHREPASGVSLDKALDMFQKGMEFAGDSSEGAGYWPVIREIGKPLIDIIAQRSGKELPTTTPAGVRIAPPPDRVAQLTPQPEVPAMPMWAQVLKPFVPHLVGLAQKGDDPSLWAAVLDSQRPQLARWLEKRVEESTVEGFLGAVIEQYPVLLPHREWLSAFLEEFSSGPVADTPDDFGEGRAGSQEPGE